MTMHRPLRTRTQTSRTFQIEYRTEHHAPFAPADAGAQTWRRSSVLPLAPRFRGDEREDMHRTYRRFWPSEYASFLSPYVVVCEWALKPLNLRLYTQPFNSRNAT